MKRMKMMKVVCVMGVMALLGGCSNAGNDVTENTLEHVSTEDAVIETTNISNHETDAEIETELNVNDWGIKYKSAVIDNDGNAMRYYINFPVWVGNDRASGRIGYQGDDVSALVAQRYNDAYDYGGEIANIFPTCFPQVIKILESDQTDTAYDYAFDITSQEMVEINGYQMCRYEGNLTYEFYRANYSNRYVAYATEVADGAYVFWMLINISQDNSSLELASEYALKMAYTLRTEE